MIGLPDWAELATAETVGAFRGQALSPKATCCRPRRRRKSRVRRSRQARMLMSPVATVLAGRTFRTVPWRGPLRRQGRSLRKPIPPVSVGRREFRPGDQPMTALRPGSRNLITDVAGLTVGNVHDERLRSRHGSGLYQSGGRRRPGAWGRAGTRETICSRRTRGRGRRRHRAFRRLRLRS